MMLTEVSCNLNEESGEEPVRHLVDLALIVD
jgi:hypothetical protein